MLPMGVMARPKPAWLSMVPRGVSPSSLTLSELRSAKLAHEFLTERVPGPEAFADYIRAYRYLLFFGIACVAEDKYPPLTRCWKELELLFMSDPALDDGVVVQSWILMDFPCGPAGQTALDYFQEFLKGTDVGPQVGRFIESARKSRLGLHQDVMRTKKVGKFRELFTGEVASVFPSITDYGKGEILLTRTIECDGQVFMWGNPSGFPKEARAHIEDMVMDKLFYFVEAGDLVEQYATFMKLAGPYWMSCVTKNDAVPILDPDHYRTYLVQCE